MKYTANFGLAMPEGSDPPIPGPMSENMEVIDSQLKRVGDSAGVSSVFGREGAVTAQPGDYNVSQITGAVRPNLLDNWYFGNPVNQRGQTEYTGDGYTIDRWKTVSGDVVAKIGEKLVMDNSQSTNTAYFGQSLEENLVGYLVTLSVLTTEGLYYSSGFVLDNNSWQLRSPIGESAELYFQKSTAGAQGVFFAIQEGVILNVLAAKLEIGSGQTLAHQDADGNWVLNEIPDYAEELAKCQRYFVSLRGASNQEYANFCMGIADTTTSALFLINPPVTMRSDSPAIVANGAFRINNAHGTTGTSASVVGAGQNTAYSARIKVTHGGNIAAGSPVFLQSDNDRTADIYLDANL